MDILQELPLDQWPVLREKLKNLWPLNLPAYNTLYVNLKYPKVKEALKFSVYCPYGDIENGFVGIHDNAGQAVILFSLTEDTSTIEEAIVKTGRIDWNRKVCFDLLTSLTSQSVERLKSRMNFSNYEKGLANMYCLSRTTRSFTDLRQPNNTYLAPVKEEHIQRVNDTWPYKHPGSHFYFTTLATNGLSYGLYSSDKHELLAWVFINEYGFLCHLYCEEEFRRRGFGEYVMRCASNELLKNGNDVYAYVVHGNDKPLAIFAKLGFKIVDESAFAFVEKLI